jgi:hypothetical protein
MTTSRALEIAARMRDAEVLEHGRAASRKWDDVVDVNIDRLY